MDENFKYFLENFGPVIERQHVPPSSIDRYRGKLPEQLLDYWQEHGWCGYADGLFWTVDPQEYEPVLEAWIGNTPYMEEDAYHIIARGAFGELYFWGEKNGPCLTLLPYAASIFPNTIYLKKMNEGKADIVVQRFFTSMERRFMDCHDEAGNPLFLRTLQSLGCLKRDEMYGFVLALALGGATKLENLQKVKAVEHLVFLAQLSELRVMTIPSS